MAEISDSTFGIGAVSRLTGIPMDTLRVWERRYQAIAPRRSAQNRRFYSRDDVTRLLLIKQLVEHGEPVGSVVHLPEAELRRQLQAHTELHRASRVSLPMESAAPPATATALIYGDALPYQIRQWAAELPFLEVLGGHTLWADFERAALANPPGWLIMEFPALQAEAVTRLRELLRQGGQSRALVVYAFAARTVLDRLRKLGVLTLRAPVTAASLRAACHGDAPEAATSASGVPPAPARIAPRRYSGQELARIAQMPTPLLCECPQHLVDLIARLGAFEDYSAACENRYEKDAQIHARLHAMTAEARALLEEALTFLLDREGIAPPCATLAAESPPVSVDPAPA